MISPQVTELIVADHVVGRQRQAAAARLAALARCCRPSTWARTIRGTGAAVANLRGRARRDRLAAAPCCAGA